MEPVATWTPRKVAAWLRGLDDSLQDYCFEDWELPGKYLLQLCPRSLEALTVCPLGHQEIILEGVEQLRALSAGLQSENLRSLTEGLLEGTQAFQSLVRGHLGGCAEPPADVLGAAVQLVHEARSLLFWLNRYLFSHLNDFSSCQAIGELCGELGQALQEDCPPAEKESKVLRIPRGRDLLQHPELLPGGAAEAEGCTKASAAGRSFGPGNPHHQQLPTLCVSSGRPGGLAPQKRGEGAAAGAGQGQFSAEEGPGAGDPTTGPHLKTSLTSTCLQTQVLDPALLPGQTQPPLAPSPCPAPLQPQPHTRQRWQTLRSPQNTLIGVLSLAAGNQKAWQRAGGCRVGSWACPTVMAGSCSARCPGASWARAGAAAGSCSRDTHSTGTASPSVFQLTHNVYKPFIFAADTLTDLSMWVRHLITCISKYQSPGRASLPREEDCYSETEAEDPDDEAGSCSASPSAAQARSSLHGDPLPAATPQGSPRTSFSPAATDSSEGALERMVRGLRLGGVTLLGQQQPLTQEQWRSSFMRRNRDPQLNERVHRVRALQSTLKAKLQELQALEEVLGDPQLTGEKFRRWKEQNQELYSEGLGAWGGEQAEGGSQVLNSDPKEPSSHPPPSDPEEHSPLCPLTPEGDPRPPDL
ncbi:connector enhancer of kinase suppressor of ras 1 isoform X5 [Muntiacus reevesi]|uniref:connector enhancer of kinase suppressor of ras 1 isoform X5 n=1 Tax=Muntiacus reevesi TaxID=9886 RepID=UPI003307AE27